MWADVETDKDFLNYSEVAELTVDLIKDQAMRPLSVGVFGTWGTGKSTLLNLVERQLNPAGDDSGDYVVVRFDAWLYQGYDDARAALMEVIASRLIAATEAKKAAAPLREKAKRFLGRVNYFRAAGLLAEASAAAFGFPTFGALSRGIGALGDVASGSVTKEDVEAAKAAGKEISEQAKGLLKAEEKRTPPEEIAAFRKELAEILGELGKTLVVFVDNLDRCLPKQTIHTLEALRLFLFMQNTAFLVAADEDMVKHSVQSFFDDIDERHVTDYLDKLVQVPVRVPRLGVQEVRAYMFMLFAVAGGAAPDKLEALRSALETNLRQAWKDDPISREAALKVLGDPAKPEVVAGFDIADRMAPLLANSSVVRGNPRIVKRMLNVVRLRSRLAARRGIPMDEPMIAKLALFERCTDAAATADLYKAIQESAGGKPDLFRELEKHSEDPEKFAGACPDSWKGKLDFIQNWVSLDPKLADVDLRPALYLSRETQPLRVVRGDLSPAAATALGALLRAPNTSSPSAKRALAACPAPERPSIMEAIVSELRKHADWKSKPPGFDGALILAAETPEAGRVLGSFIKTFFGAAKLPPWLVVLTKGATWFSSAGGG